MSVNKQHHTIDFINFEKCLLKNPQNCENTMRNVYSISLFTPMGWKKSTLATRVEVWDTVEPRSDLWVVSSG